MSKIKDELAAFLSKTLVCEDYDIILTGAGTSQFVGDALEPYLQSIHGFRLRSVGTTDIVASPRKYVCADRPTLIVSFARSGNSPESVGTVKACDEVCSKVNHLFITCNKDGKLAKEASGRDDCFSIVLTPETNDLSFAMTSSFTNMLLAALLALAGDKVNELAEQLEAVCSSAEKALGCYSVFENAVSTFDYKRLVYLGGAELMGIARESALKSLELTAGRVVSLYDSPMGFRHGPKSVIDDETLTVIYMSNDPVARRYERDLLMEISRERKGNRIFAITDAYDAETEAAADFYYAFENAAELPDVLLGLDYIVVAQLLALFKSQSFGITSDNPCPTGEVNRVVAGVTIYPFA